MNGMRQPSESLDRVCGFTYFMMLTETYLTPDLDIDPQNISRIGSNMCRDPSHAYKRIEQIEAYALDFILGKAEHYTRFVICILRDRAGQ